MKHSNIEKIREWDKKNSDTGVPVTADVCAHALLNSCFPPLKHTLSPWASAHAHCFVITWAYPHAQQSFLYEKHLGLIT